ncbi:MAG: ester cyclase [Desulfobacterales bacterium]|nr:ester cyclase [Desulfobacterales bacterium]
MIQKRRSVFLTVFLLMLFVLPISSQCFAVDSLAVLDSYIAGWNSHDATKCADHFAEDIVFYDATVGEPVTGSENAKNEIVKSFMAAVPDLKLERSGDVIIKNNALVWQWTFSGTNTGDWSDGTKATNKSFKISGLTLMKLKDGKIAYSGDYYDAYGFYQQLGLLE